MSTILSRLEEIASNEGLTITAFERYIGASKGVLSRAINKGTDIQLKWIQSVVENFPLYSEGWLLTGKGSMMKDHSKSADKRHKPFYAGKKIEEQSVYLYDINAAANLKTLFRMRGQNVLGEIKIPNLPKCDGALYVKGDSMYPLIKSGDMIVYKEIKSLDDIIYGEMYLMSFDLNGDKYLTLKYVNKSEEQDCFKLVSYNQYHAPMDVHKSKIDALAIVKASIRLNTMS